MSTPLYWFRLFGNPKVLSLIQGVMGDVGIALSMNEATKLQQKGNRDIIESLYELLTAKS